MEVKMDWSALQLTDHEGNQHHIHGHEFWVLAPCKPASLSDRDLAGFGLMLHNARVGQGFVAGQNQLFEGIPITVPNRGPGTQVVEDMFEKTRQQSFPERPSRLRCHFLFSSKDHAIAMKKKWASDGFADRELVNCFLVLSSGRYHFADVEAYETAVATRPTLELAERYWSEYLPGKFDECRIEVLADSGLYFPGWESFPLLDSEVLAEWNKRRLMCRS